MGEEAGIIGNTQSVIHFVWCIHKAAQFPLTMLVHHLLSLCHLHLCNARCFLTHLLCDPKDAGTM